MIVFRFEHNRDICTSRVYKTGGSSPTGHGPHSGGCGWEKTPNFGGRGAAPKRIMEHERCAVTVDQFKSWITPERRSLPCKFSTKYCEGEQLCYYCVEEVLVLKVSDEWDLVAYSLNAAQEGIDWRYDNNQVIFNPEFAVRVRTVDVMTELVGILPIQVKTV